MIGGCAAAWVNELLGFVAEQLALFFSAAAFGHVFAGEAAMIGGRTRPTSVGGAAEEQTGGRYRA